MNLPAPILCIHLLIFSLTHIPPRQHLILEERQLCVFSLALANSIAAIQQQSHKTCWSRRTFYLRDRSGCSKTCGFTQKQALSRLGSVTEVAGVYLGIFTKIWLYSVIERCICKSYWFGVAFYLRRGRLLSLFQIHKEQPQEKCSYSPD